jgi:hypothetical protein
MECRYALLVVIWESWALEYNSTIGFCREGWRRCGRSLVFSLADEPRTASGLAGAGFDEVALNEAKEVLGYDFAIV